MQGDDHLGPLLDTFKKNFSKAVVLINSADNCSVSFDLTYDMVEIHFPVVLVTKSVGDQIQHCLKEGKKECEDVYARIEVDIAEDKVEFKYGLQESSRTHQHNFPTIGTNRTQCETINMYSCLSKATYSCTHERERKILFWGEIPDQTQYWS